MSWVNVSGLKVTSLVSDEKTRLTNDRWRLQDEIMRLLQDAKGGSKLEATISSYNEVIEDLHNLEMGPRVDPMDKLPNEIMTSILLEVSTYIPSWYIIRFMDSLIDLTMVSKKWRKFILSEPLLWNGISLANRPDFCAITSIQLALSKDSPLTLQINLPFEQWNSIRSDIIKHRDRIETIVIAGYYSHDKGLEKDKDIRRILEDLGPLPSLQRLGEPHQPYDQVYCVPWIIDHCQSLEELINIAIATQDLRAAKNRLTIRELTTYDHLERILPVAETIKELRKVVFLTGPSTFPSDDAEKTHPQQAPLSTHPLRWTHLTCSRYDSKIPKPLLHRLPNLVMLDINTDSYTLQYIVSIADQFPSLGHFKAMTFLKTEDKIFFPDNIAPNLNGHKLELYIFCQRSYTFPNKLGPKFDQLCQSVHIVPEMMLHAMPNAKYLSLSINGMHSEFPFFSLDNYFTGEEVYLSFSNCSVTPMPDSHIPTSVEKLSVTCSRTLTCSLSSKTLTSLVIQRTYLMREEPSISSSALPMLDLSAWPSLEVISFYDNWIMWSKHSLTYLKKVTILKDYDKYNLRNDITSFVRDIARSPESHPSLEELDFGDCPEWDIFMIMLERRNLLASRGVARITKLRIQSSCPPKIYHVISQLVLGKWTERPSNWELSIAENAEIILDLSLPGCFRCHKALRRCETLVKTNWQPEPGHDEEVFLSRLQEYPASEDEILNTWEERAKLWEDWNKRERWTGVNLREMICENQSTTS
ncbi:hypothetical protein CPB86DRAFT_876480 [Serendipita vermifera]|nr:hypothetical protein CPB86DRAFT_876480 [Serendipita vermifera]